MPRVDSVTGRERPLDAQGRFWDGGRIFLDAQVHFWDKEVETSGCPGQSRF